jgi:hypothetical protein
VETLRGRTVIAHIGNERSVLLLTMLGWILPPATSGVLVRHVPPQLSLIAISENEKPSE